MVFYVTTVIFRMTFLMIMWTNIMMDDGWVHPLTKTLPPLVSHSSLGSASILRTPCLLQNLLPTMREFAQCDDFNFYLFCVSIEFKCRWDGGVLLEFWGLDLAFLPSSQVGLHDLIFDKLGFRVGLIWFGYIFVEALCKVLCRSM